MARKVKVVQNVVRVVKHKQVGAQGPEGSIEGLQSKIAFDLTGAAVNQGELAWNPDEDTLDLGQHERVLQLGQELGYFARNGNAGLISNGRPVMVTGTIGNSGRMVFDLMDGTNPANAKYFLGLVTEDFDSGEDGHVTSFGKVRGIDTTGTLSFGGLETWNDADVLYVDPVNIGYLTNVAPTAPDMSLAVAFVIHAHVAGTLFVRATALDENALGGSGGGIGSGDTLPSSPTTNDLFIHDKGATSTILKRWNGSSWKSILTFGDSLNFYVDWTNGTDSDEHGYAAGASAYKTVAYAIARLPETSEAAISINLSRESHPSGAVTINKSALDITFQGTLEEILGTTTPTGSAAGSITVSGAGWTTNAYASRWMNQAGTRYYIISNTTDTLQIRENVTLPLTDFTIEQAPSLSGPLFVTARRATVRNLNIYINTFGFVGQVYADEFAELDTCFFKSAGTFVNRACYMQVNGTALISDCNFETALLTDSPLWLQGPGQYNLSNVRSWKAVLSDNGAILFRGCKLNISNSYCYRGGLQGLWGAELFNSNTVLNSIMVRLANIGLLMDVSCGRPEYGDIVFDSCTVDTQLDMLQVAADVAVEASGFSGNLSATDTDVQTALATLDAMSAGGGISAGATLPASPTAQDLFIHTPTGRTWLMRYDGAAWIPEIQLDDSDASVYVDATLGTDSQNNGFGSGADAFATLNFAFSNLPHVGNGQRIIINVAEDDYTAEGFIILDRETLDVAIYGVPSTVATETITGKGLGTITVAGAGWTTDEHAGRWANISSTNWYIISNTADTLTVQQNVDISTATSPAWTTLNIQDYPLLGGTGAIITQSKNIDIQGFNVTSSYSNYITQFLAQQQCLVKRIAAVASNNSGRAMSIFADSMAVESCHLEHTSSINDNYLFNSERGKCVLYQVNAIKAKAGASVGNYQIRAGHGVFTRTRSDGGGYVAAEGGSIQFNNFPCDVIDAAVGAYVQSTGLGYSIGSGLLTFTNCTTDILDDRPQGGSSSGTSFPSNPVKGHTFLLSLTGREVQFVYDGTDWVPTVSIGAMTMYVDGASGTDSVTSGTGTGTSAFATIQYAIDQVPPIYSGNVDIYVASGTYDEIPIIRGKSPSGDYDFTIHGTLTDLETAVSATCTLGTGGNHGTVTKTGQFTGDAYSKKLAYFETSLQHRVILSHTNDTLQLVGQIPSATTQDVTIRDWATSLDPTSGGYAFQCFCDVNFRGMKFNGLDRGLVENCNVDFYECFFEFGCVYSNSGTGSIRWSMLDTTKSYPLEVQNFSRVNSFYNYFSTPAGYEGPRAISLASLTFRGCYVEGANERYGIVAQEGSNISFWSTDATYGDTIIDDWSVGIYSFSGSGIANTATYCQFISCPTNTNTEPTKFAWLD